jgi:hypothetical protein
MPKHPGEIILANIRERQRRELQRRLVLNPTTEKIMDPRLNSLIADINELDTLLSERSEAAVEAANAREIDTAIHDIGEAISRAQELVATLPEDDDIITEAIVAEAVAEAEADEAAE